MVIRAITFWLAVSRDSGKHFTLPIFFFESQTRANRLIFAVGVAFYVVFTP